VHSSSEKVICTWHLPRWAAEGTIAKRAVR
jgi:hypothetical protein